MHARRKKTIFQLPRRHLVWARTLFVLLLGFYVYVLLRVRPELLYQQSPGLLVLDTSFLATFLDQPGGAVECAWALASPLFAVGWLGALVITLFAGVVCLATRGLLAAMSPGAGSSLAFVPLLPVAMLLGQYHCPVRLCAGLCVVLALTGVYAGFGDRHLTARAMALGILSALTYWATAGLYVVFALLCGIFEWRIYRRRAWGVAWVACAVIVPMGVGAWFCVLSVEEAYRGLPLPRERYWLAAPSFPLLVWAIRLGLLLFFPIAALAATWRGRSAGSSGFSAKAFSPTAGSDNAIEAAGRPSGGLRLAVALAGLIALSIAADMLLFDVGKKDSLLVAFSAEREQWSEVLRHARRLASSDPRTVFQVNRALYHRGELLERMFEYPQASDSAARLTLQFENVTATARRAPLESSDLLFELGRINESQHMAYEALEMFGAWPRTLQRLVWLHAIKGEPDAARKFLAVLEQGVFHRDWARQFLRLLDADPTLAAVPEVARRRALMVERDFTGTLDTETMLLHLLDRNPQNRMAFEYLMAYYLLTRQIDRVAANLSRFDDFGQAGLPRHCEEAILIYSSLGGTVRIDLKGRQIRPETHRRGLAFAQAASRFQGNSSAAFAALYPEFGDTYFFFFLFGCNDPRLFAARPSR